MPTNIVTATFTHEFDRIVWIVFKSVPRREIVIGAPNFNKIDKPKISSCKLQVNDSNSCKLTVVSKTGRRFFLLYQRLFTPSKRQTKRIKNVVQIDSLDDRI